MSEPAAASPRAVIVFSNVGHVFTHMFVILYATAVLHLPQVFSLPYGELLGLSSLGLVLFGVGALPAGWLGDRWSQTGMMVVFFFGCGAGAIVTGLATDTAALFAGLTLIGLFASIYHPVGIAWLVAHASRQGMTLGLNGVFGGVGSAIAPVFVGVMIDHISWRAAFVVPGILAVACGVALLLAWRTGRVADARADRVEQAKPDRDGIRRVFVLLTLTMAGSGFVYTGVTNTMPKVFEGGLGPVLAASYTELGFLVGAVVGVASLSSLLGGWLADRYTARAIYIAFWFALVLPVYLVPASTGYALLAIVGIALVFNTAFAAAENMLVARYTPFRWRSLAYGAKFVLALGIGGLTVQLAGTLYDRTGSFDLLYGGFAAAALLSALCALLLPREARSPARVVATAGGG